MKMEELKENLPPLQLSVYDYVSKHKKVEYSKNELLKALNLSSQTVLTRGVNSLIKKSLVEVETEGSTIYLKVIKRDSQVEGVSVSEVAEGVIDYRVTSDEKINDLNLTVAKDEVGVETLAEKNLSSPLVEESPQPLRTIIKINEDTKEKKELTLIETVVPKSVQDTCGAVNPDESVKKEINMAQAIIKNYKNIGKTRSQIINMFKTSIPETVDKVDELDKDLTTQEKRILLMLYYSYVKKNKWPENKASSIGGSVELNKKVVSKSRKRLAEKGYVTTSVDEEKKGVTRLALTKEGAKRVVSIIKKGSELLEKKPKKKKENIPIIVNQNETFKSHIYLIDTENVGLMIKESILKQLKPHDIVFLCLSDSSGREKITSEDLHWILQAPCQVKSLLVRTEGTGRNDLDHVLTTELVLQVHEKPDAQFIVISNDKGYLAAIKYLMERMKMKEEQVLLQSHF